MVNIPVKNPRTTQLLMIAAGVMTVLVAHFVPAYSLLLSQILEVIGIGAIGVGGAQITGKPSEPGDSRPVAVKPLSTRPPGGIDAEFRAWRHRDWRFGLSCVCAMLLTACALDPVAPSQPRADSVVTMLQLVAPPPCLGFPEEPCRYASRYEPSCAAFALTRAGKKMLVTASHCVPDGATDSTPLRFRPPSGFGHGRAYLLERNAAADVAFLALGEPELVTPLRVGRSPRVGESVSSYSPIFRARSSGLLADWLGEDWFETTQTVTAGWSGSPILDERDDVVGVVSQCPAAVDGAAKRCAPGSVVATAALCFRAD